MMRLFPLLAGLLVFLQAPLALAQPNLRSTFPGRRVGGGTRGECTARVLAHLVPESSVFAPGSSGWIGLVEGPSAAPRQLQVTFRAAQSAGSSQIVRQLLSQRNLPPSPAGILLLRLPGQAPMVWESMYLCAEGTADPSDPLAVVSAGSPPAVTLLVADVTSADRTIQTKLSALQSLCGKTLPRQQLVADFDLADVISPDWPAQLPVRCAF